MIIPLTHTISLLKVFLDRHFTEKHLEIVELIYEMLDNDVHVNFIQAVGHHFSKTQERVMLSNDNNFGYEGIPSVKIYFLIHGTVYIIVGYKRYQFKIDKQVKLMHLIKELYKQKKFELLKHIPKITNKLTKQDINKLIGILTLFVFKSPQN